MKWTVVNAQSRDVERQHLNKILKEIQGSYSDISSKLNVTSEGLGNVESGLTSVITKVINNTLPAGDLATQVTLTGDVTGVSEKVPGQNAVTIATTITGFLQDAPIDSNAYWRFQGTWQAVPSVVQNMSTINSNGYLVIDDNGYWQSRAIESADEGRIVVTDGDAGEGNTVLDLATVTNSNAGSLLAITRDTYGRVTGTKAATITGTAGNIVVTNGDAVSALPTINLATVADTGTGVLQRTSFDAFGRKTGTAAATTDNLTEGTTNLYFSNERAQDAVGTILTDTAEIDFTYNDVSNTITADLTAGVRLPIAAAGVLATSGYIDGMVMSWNSASSISFTSGTVAIPSSSTLLRFPSAVTKSGLSLAASTFYHCYAYSNAGTPDVEISTTVPVAYLGTARNKTGDTSRRYLGTFLTDASGSIHQFIVSGNLVLYPKGGAGGGSIFRVLNAKITAVEQAVALSGVIPITASGVFARFFFNRTVGDNAMNFGPTAGLPKLNNVTSPGVAFFTVPLTSSQLLYIVLNNDVVDGNGAAYIDVNGYTYDR
jgi:hypothetical protein